MEAERFDSPLKVRAVDPITISDYEPGGRLPRERLDHLLCGPLGGWVCGHADVEDSSSLQAQHHEYKQQSEGHRRHHGEVDCDSLRKMIAEERAPSLGRWFSLSWQVLRDGRLGGCDPELEEFAVNSRRTPGGIGPVHLKDELSDFVGDRRPAGPVRSALPTPIEAETLPVPAEDGLRLNEDESATPSGPDLREVGPQESIGGPKRDAPSRALALENEELMAQGEYLGLERSPAAE